MCGENSPWIFGWPKGRLGRASQLIPVFILHFLRNKSLAEHMATWNEDSISQPPLHCNHIIKSWPMGRKPMW